MYIWHQQHTHVANWIDYKSGAVLILGYRFSSMDNPILQEGLPHGVAYNGMTGSLYIDMGLSYWEFRIFLHTTDSPKFISLTRALYQT